MTVMLEQVEETVTELSALVAALVNDHGADPHRLCAVGISMGAFVAYRAIVTGPPFRSVVALLGNPDGMSPRRAQAYDAVRGVALLSITAEFDVSVPPGPTSVFHEELLRRFGASDRHHHHVLRGAGHLTSSAQWDEAMRETMRWLELSRVFGGGRTSGDDV